MGAVTYGDLCKAIATALKNAGVGKRVEAYDEISESIPEQRTLHVYFNDGDVTSGSDNDRKTFQASKRTTAITAVIDGYARRRSSLHDDLKAQMELIDEIDTYLCSQTALPLLGHADIKSFHWRWERSLFPYAKEDWAGCRFELEIWVY